VRVHSVHHCLCAACKEALRARLKAAALAEYRTQFAATEDDSSAMDESFSGSSGSSAPPTERRDNSVLFYDNGQRTAAPQNNASAADAAAAEQRLRALYHGALFHASEAPRPMRKRPKYRTASVSGGGGGAASKPRDTRSADDAHNARTDAAGETATALTATQSLTAAPALSNVAPTARAAGTGAASPLLDFLCPACRCHAHAAVHILGGRGRWGVSVVSERALDELSRSSVRSVLLEAYGLASRVSLADAREFLSKLEPSKRARAERCLSAAEIRALFQHIPGVNDEKEGMDFYAVSAAISAHRAATVAALRQMYPNVSKPPPQPQQQQQARYTASQLTTAILEYKFAPHASSILRERLLHKYTHAVVSLAAEPAGGGSGGGAAGSATRALQGGQSLVHNILLTRTSAPVDRETNWRGA
jgi:hypothetical protein